MLPESGFGESQVDIVRIDTINGTPVYVFHQVYSYPINYNAPEGGEVYLRNHDDGLYCYGYYGNTEIAPLKPAGSVLFEFGGKSYASAQELCTAITGSVLLSGLAQAQNEYEIPPLRSIAYPPEEDYQWNYREVDNPWLIDKRYLEPQEVQTPAGTFQCYVISWLYDRDADGVWDDDIELYDYISDIGLVRRIYTYHDIGIMREEELLGTCDITIDYYLTRYEIKTGW